MNASPFCLQLSWKFPSCPCAQSISVCSRSWNSTVAQHALSPSHTKSYPTHEQYARELYGLFAFLHCVLVTKTFFSYKFYLYTATFPLDSVAVNIYTTRAYRKTWNTLYPTCRHCALYNPESRTSSNTQHSS